MKHEGAELHQGVSPRVSFAAMRCAALFLLLFPAAFYLWSPLSLVMVAPLTLAAVAAGRGTRRIITFACVACWLGTHWLFAVMGTGLWLTLGLVHGGLHAAGLLGMRWLHTRTGLPLALLLPVTWIPVEWLRLLPPWGVHSGVLAFPLALEEHVLWLQTADLGGMALVSFGIALINGLVADAWLAGLRRRIPWQEISALAAVLLAAGSYGAWRLAESKQTARTGPLAGIAQPDVPGGTADVGLGFDPDLYLTEMLRMSTEAVQRGAAFVVWPESPAPLPPLHSDAAARSPEELAFLHRTREWVQQAGVPLVFGCRRLTPEGGHYNSVWLWRAGQSEPEVVQDKVRLFPFGESVPWVPESMRQRIASALGGRMMMTPGKGRPVTTLPGGLRCLFAVCNEAGFADSSGTFTGGPDKPSGALIVLASEGDFGRNHALPWHAAFLAFRAIESRISVVRSANTGISLVVHPSGEIAARVQNALGQTWTGKGAPELPEIEALVQLRRDEEQKISDPAYVEEVNRRIARIEALRAASGVSGSLTAPVLTDPRRTLYSRTGDWVGPLCAGCWGLLAARQLFRLRSRREAAA